MNNLDPKMVALEEIIEAVEDYLNSPINNSWDERMALQSLKLALLKAQNKLEDFKK